MNSSKAKKRKVWSNITTLQYFGKTIGIAVGILLTLFGLLELFKYSFPQYIYNNPHTFIFIFMIITSVSLTFAWHISQQSSSGCNDLDINLDSLTYYLRTRFPDRKESSSKNVSSLVNDFKRTGYQRISDIERAINIGWDAFLLFEEENPPHGKKDAKYRDVGAIRILFDLIDDDFRQITQNPTYPNRYKRLIKR